MFIYFLKKASKPLGSFMYFCPDAKVPKHFASRRRGCYFRVTFFCSIQIVDLGYGMYFSTKKSTKSRRSFADFKGRLCRGGYLQVSVRNVLQRNIIVSFPLQSDIKLLSAVLCEISVTIFIFAKRYFPLSALDYRLLQKVA